MAASEAAKDRALFVLIDCLQQSRRPFSSPLTQSMTSQTDDRKSGIGAETGSLVEVRIARSCNK